MLLGGGMNKRDGLCGENVCRDGNISKAGWPLPPGSLSLHGGCSRGGSLPTGRMVCRQGPRCPRGCGEGDVFRVPPPPSALAPPCLHVGCLSPFLGVFGRRERLRKGEAAAAGLQRRWLCGAPPKAFSSPSWHCFLQRHMGSASTTTTAWLQPCILNGAGFFPWCLPAARRGPPTRDRAWHQTFTFLQFPFLYIFFPHWCSVGVEIFPTGPPVCLFGQNVPFPVTAQTVLFPQVLAEKLIPILGVIFWLCGRPVPVALGRAAPQWAGSGPPALQP